MQFTSVIFNTYKLFRESLATAKLAHSFLMSKNVVVLNLLTVTNNALLSCTNIFLLKEFVFTSPQLKITLFNTVYLQLAHFNSYFFFRKPRC